jgi:hypothetical protein
MLSISNLNKPSNKKWKTVADFLLYTMPLYLSAILAIPVSEDIKLWSNFIITVIIVTIKGISKFTSEEIPADTP